MELRCSAPGDIPEPAHTPNPLNVLSELRLYLQQEQDRALRARNDCATLLGEIEEGILICDRKGRPMQANAAMACLLGFESGDQLVAQCENAAELLFHPETAWPEHLARIDSGNPLRGLKISLQQNKERTPDGELRIVPLDSRSAPPDRYAVIFHKSTPDTLVVPPAGQPEHNRGERLEQLIDLRSCELYSKTRQLTGQMEENVRIERELQQAQEEIQSANSAKSVFLASMSHELRTPINAMLGMSQVLAESNLNELQAQYVRILKAACEGLLINVNNLLDVSNYEAGQLHLETKNFQLSEIINKISVLVRPQAQAKNLALYHHTDHRLPACFSGDPARLLQILLNIVNNSVKFTEQGNITLRVEPQSNITTDAPMLLRFSIADTGIGISPELGDTIFDYFTQEDSSITRKHHGIGLGLAASKMLVELMGGTIWYNSKPDQGSEFHFTIQLLPLSSETSAGKLPLWPSSHAASPTGLSLRILVVEDSRFNAVVVETFLKDTRCLLDFAINGAMGLEMFLKQSYDLVLMDIQMPVMDGCTAARKMRQWEHETNRPQTPIFAMTAYGTKEDRQRSLDAGCNLHLVKPIKKEQLLGALHAWFSSPDFTASGSLREGMPPHSQATEPPVQQEVDIDVPVDPELFEIAPTYLETVKVNLRKLDELVQKQEFDVARTIGHQMKGEGKLFGLNLVSKLGQVIQQAAEAGDSNAILYAAHELLSYLERVRLVSSE